MSGIQSKTTKHIGARVPNQNPKRNKMERHAEGESYDGKKHQTQALTSMLNMFSESKDKIDNFSTEMKTTENG